MANQGECPKCGKRVLHVHVETIVGMVGETTKGRCISYCCIHCNAILGVQIDHRAKPRARARAAPKA